MELKISEQYNYLNTEFTKRIVLFGVYGKLGEPFLAKPNLPLSILLYLGISGTFEVRSLNWVSRECSHPTPMFGGADCLGNITEKSLFLCYGGDCCPGSYILKYSVIKLNYFLLTDSSDYIGCFRKDKGTYTSSYILGGMNHCKCVGYCNSLNFSLSATGTMAFVRH